MKTYVINLPQSTERRKFMDAQLERVGIEPEYVDAIDGSRLTADERAILVDEEAVARSPRWLIPGVIGCCLSHLEVYRRIAAEGPECALILEDDAVLSARPKPLLSAVESHLHGADVVLMYYRSNAPCRLSDRHAIDLGEGVRLLHPIDREPLASSVAYVITRSACRRMSEFVLPIRMGADNWDTLVRAGALDRVRCVFPRPFSTRTDFKSTLGYLSDSAPHIQKVTSAIDRRRVFPLYQLLGWQRRRIESRMSEITVVSEPAETYDA